MKLNQLFAEFRWRSVSAPDLLLGVATELQHEAEHPWLVAPSKAVTFRTNRQAVFYGALPAEAIGLYVANLPTVA